MANAGGPTVSTVDPPSGPPGTFLTVTGSGLQTGDTVQISSTTLGTLALATYSLTSSAIVATLPGSGLSAGDVTVRVQRGTSTVPAQGLPFTVTSGRVFYIAPSGSDSNPGTKAAPWLRIDTAASKMLPGDVAYLRGGTYSSAYSIHTGGTATAPMSFIGYPGETPLLVAPATSAQYNTLSIQASYINFRHITVSDQHDPGICVEIVLAAHDILIADSEVYGSLGIGILLAGSYNTLLRNRVHDNGSHSKYDHGIYIDSGHNLFRGNWIYNNWTYGMHFYNGGGVPSGYNVAENNVIYHNGYGSKAAGFSVSAGIILADVHNNDIIRNNITCDNADSGILVSAYQPGEQITGNVSCYNHTAGFNISQPAGTDIFTNNISYNDATPALIMGASITSDNNVYWKTGGTPTLQWNGVNYNLAGFQSASGLELHSRVADPGFANVPSSGFDSTQMASYNFCGPFTPTWCNAVASP
jgi:hypothetical protein